MMDSDVDTDEAREVAGDSISSSSRPSVSDAEDDEGLVFVTDAAGSVEECLDAGADVGDSAMAALEVLPDVGDEFVPLDLEYTPPALPAFGLWQHSLYLTLHSGSLEDACRLRCQRLCGPGSRYNLLDRWPEYAWHKCKTCFAA